MPLSCNASLLKVGDDFPRKHLAQISNAWGVLYTSLLSGLYWGCLCLLLMDVGPWHLSKVFCPSSPVGSTVATVTWEALRYTESILGDKKRVGIFWSSAGDSNVQWGGGGQLLPLQEQSCPRGPATCAVTKGPPINCVLCSCRPERFLIF